MVTPQLTDYIRTQLKQGVGKEAVRAQLLSNGWQAADVEMAFNAVYAEQPTIPGPTPSFSLVNHPKPHGNKTLPVMVLSVLGLALLAGSAFAYPYVFPPAPEKVVEDMFAKMPEVRSFGYKLGLKSGISETSAVPGFGSIGAVDVSLDLDGAIDLNDLNSINNAVALDLKVGATSPSLQFSINLGLEEMNMGSDVYLRLTKIPTLPLPIDLSPLLNQWVKLDAKTYIAQSGLGEQLSSERDLSAEQKEKIAELRGKIIKITGKLPSESISGVSTYHYAFEMDKIALSSSIVEISSILGNAMSDDQIAAFNKGLESVQSMGGEIWIGKGDRLLYKTILNVAFSATNDSNPIQTLAISYEAGDYNEPVQIEVPESAKTLEEVLTGFSGQSYPQENLAKARDTQRLSDLASLKTAIGIYVATKSNPNLCVAGKTYSSLNGTTAVDGTGWIPVNLSSITGGSPISELPKDPTNNSTYYYTYSCNRVTQTFEINAIFESTDFGSGGLNDKSAADGGNNSSIYEVGTDLKILSGRTTVQSSTPPSTPVSDQFVLQGQDSQRLSDLNSLNSAMALYVTDVSVANQFMKPSCLSGKVYSSLQGTTAVDGTGWVPVNFNQISGGGSPISELPKDPINNSLSYYTFGCDPVNKTYEFNAKLKSDKYIPFMSSDGGNNANLYEIGTDPGLKILN